MKPIEIKGAWWLPKGIDGICLFPFLVYRDHEPSPALVRHERYHFHDALRCKVIPWYLAYLLLLPFYGGGREHPLEVAAYAAEKEGE